MTSRSVMTRVAKVLNICDKLRLALRMARFVAMGQHHLPISTIGGNIKT
jgi:hypothetical protein